jgi:hypothetical protein
VLFSAAFLFLVLYTFSSRLFRPAVSHPPYQEIIDAATKPEIVQPAEKELVVASLAGDDTSWLDEFFDGWRKNVYVVNDAAAPLTVAVNKGREAMPFLTYVLASAMAPGPATIRDRLVARYVELGEYNIWLSHRSR